jgi:hypothetical protein
MAKRKNGKRDRSGKLLRPTTRAAREKHDYGNDRCVERLERFRHPNILNGKAAWIDVFDGVGQLHAIGMLEGHGLDGTLLRDAGREYIGLYNYVYIDMLPKGSDLERVYAQSGTGKADNIPPATRREIRFAALDDLLPTASAERYWTHQVLLNHFGLDTVHPIVDRLVNYKMAQWKIPDPGTGYAFRDIRVAGAEDFQILGCVLRGLFALADGAMPNRWSKAA